jgi:hypothetical protein
MMKENGLPFRLILWRWKIMKRIMALCLCIAMLLFILPADAETYWKMYWKPVEYIMEITSEEETQIAEIIVEAVHKSEGTPVRIDADQESAEVQYERFISLFPDGNPIEYKDVEYEDIGYYRWAVGIPDDQSVSLDEAWKTTLNFLLDQNLATPEILVHYYPQATFDTGYDPENPVWKITLTCYDYEESDLPITAWEVAVYAHDGSICGYREVSGAG